MKKLFLTGLVLATSLSARAETLKAATPPAAPVVAAEPGPNRTRPTGAKPQEIFVAPNGEDSADGTRKAPLQSFAAAQHAARRLASQGPVTITFTPTKPFLFDRISIHESPELKDLGDNFSKLRSFRIEEFTIDTLQNGEWHTFLSGTQIGAAKVHRFPNKIEAEKLRIRILKASAPPGIQLITVADSSTRTTR